MEKLLDIGQASETLGLTKSTIYKYITERSIPHVKLGSRVLFSPAALEEWVAERSVPSTGSGRKPGR